MKRILIGLIAVAVLAAGGWFGFNLYAQHRVTADCAPAPALSADPASFRIRHRACFSVRFNMAR